MDTNDMSGFGGGYEECCQRLLTNGLVYLTEKGDIDGLKYKSYKNVYGICIPKGELSEEMDQAIMEGEDDVSGAMHQAAVSHTFWIAKNGYEAWIAESRRRDPGNVYELEDPKREAIMHKWPCKKEDTDPTDKERLAED